MGPSKVSPSDCNRAVPTSTRSEGRSTAENETSGTTWLDDYEYVIVGSGPGGGPVAARLAIAGFKVLAIDAGDDQGSTYQEQVPALSLKSTEYGPMKWDYFVNHYQDEARQEKDSKMTWQTPSGDLFVGIGAPAGSAPLGILYPRAGTLGGCSSHNALITVLPHDSDWTDIADITGDTSWSPDNMRTYFEKLERNRYLPSSVIGHGYTGWLGTALTDLSLVVEDFKVLSLIVSAATAMGKSLVGIVIGTVVGLGEVLLRDLNAPGQVEEEGLYQVPLATADSTRNGPRNFILDTANSVNANGSRKYHLDIRLNTLVTKIRFTQNGTTPKAVGVDFLDGQSLYRADLRANNTFLQTMPDPCLTRWINGVTPALKGAYATNGIAIAVIKKSSVAIDDPDLLISGVPAYFPGYFPGYSNFAVKDARHWSWIVLKAHSRNNAGTVKLHSTDPRDVPIINFNSFETGVTADDAAEKDLQAVYEGIEYAREAFKVLIPLDGSFSEVWPGPNVTTETEMKDFLKAEAWGHHASCTCPIGADDDTMAVLDSKFRVRGVQGLRVVDASVFPKIPGFFIVLPIYIISEKAADVIIQDAA
ncbi:Oxygen-dependent choline dehydrogenase [Lachnellula hyalina]|uniref:Oxygen-dependent choline dehydrogenase n=1 Tax=Lachnellula hyalina TaxID=1316788 RepID=A0A8H8TX59_9HELO|nr:Oxygen-dependent choline dehydrogenase [Lachnellula hyalina]TVY25182.1 Oxygen-dependent choline dehydrogenase [Lachnellula hyalina]